MARRWPVESVLHTQTHKGDECRNDGVQLAQERGTRDRILGTAAVE